MKDCCRHYVTSSRPILMFVSVLEQQFTHGGIQTSVVSLIYSLSGCNNLVINLKTCINKILINLYIILSLLVLFMHTNSLLFKSHLLWPDWIVLFSTALACPPNSHYSMCVSSCPETCVGVSGPPGCGEKCVEGCECDPGFVLSHDECVPLKDCGCVDPEGSYHPVSLLFSY